MGERLIVLLDMDCFYVQVEERHSPEIKGKPAAVVQYNTWKGGGIIAVNYEARAYGVKRGMRGHEAKEKCPSIHLVQVPVQRGKADLSKYRNAGKEVVEVLCQFSDVVERASIDEAYIDFTSLIESKIRQGHSWDLLTKENLPSTWVVGHDQDDDGDSLQSSREKGLLAWFDKANGSLESQCRGETLRLGLTALICEEMRAKVLEETGFKCSAGISFNKMLAKLACGLHKPNQQTVLPMQSVPHLWSTLPIGKVRNLGGKLGDSLTEDMNCKTMGDLSRISLTQLRAKFDEKTSQWLHGLGCGVDNEPVIARQLPKSIGCGKNFNGKDILNTKEKVQVWLRNLIEELTERLNEDQDSNERTAKTLSVHVRLDVEDKPVSSRSCPLTSYKPETIIKAAQGLIGGLNTAASKEDTWHPPIRNITLSASKFEDLCTTGTTKISNIFKVVDQATARINLLRDLESRNFSQASPGGPSSKEGGKSKGTQANDSKEKSELVNGSPQSSFFLKFLNKKLNPQNQSLCSVEDGDVEPKHSLDLEETNESSSSDVFEASTDEDERDDLGSVEVKEMEMGEKSPILKSSRGRLATFDSPEEVGSNPKEPTIANPSVSNSQTAGTSDVYDSVSVRDIFPNLNDIDWSVVEMLPAALKSRVFAEFEKHKSNVQRSGDSDDVIDLTTSPPDSSDVGSNSFKPKLQNKLESKFCRECNRKIPPQTAQEHEDYHFAMELRKQQMKEAQNSIVAKSKNSKKGVNSPSKRRKMTKSKGTKVLTPNIERYFKKI